MLRLVLLILLAAPLAISAANSPFSDRVENVRDKNGRTLPAYAAARNEGLPALAIDLTRSTVVATPAPGPETKAVALLVEEVEERSLIRWPVHSSRPTAGATIIVGTFEQVRPLAPSALALDPRSIAAEGYQIATLSSAAAAAPVVVIAGKDSRGVLFGIGHLLRTLHYGPSRVGLMAPLNLATWPKYPLRGHQLGYRPKPNSYSGWDVSQWESYVRDLVVFGCNAIELIPPRSDDAADSPHFPRPQLDMMVAMSRICADYGLDVWVWYPALDDDYSKSETVEFALKEWGEVFAALPRLDAVLVPGGDPGHTPVRLMFPLLEKQTANLRKYHPKATMWLSPQGFKPDDMEYFFAFLRDRKPAYLAGAVFAPWVNMDLSEFRRRVPPPYQVRYYPDITHTRTCQYPVNDWDYAFAQTQGREPICPRPEDMATIVRLLQPHTMGAITYSEGCTDDANKQLWAALSWNPDADPKEILRDYARYFISERFAADFAEGLFMLERNWRGPLAESRVVPATLAHFQKMEKAATPRDLRNWRFQMALFRAYFDAAVQQRLRHELELETRALNVLRRRAPHDALAAMSEAEIILDYARTHPVAPLEHRRVYQLAEALFQSISMKLSVPLYRALSLGRGAYLDSFEWPLNNGPWLRQRFVAIRQLPDQPARAAALREIAEWENPGPGGFYDDLGNPSKSPRLVRKLPYGRDPAFIHSPLVTHTRLDITKNIMRVSWSDSVGTLNDVPLSLRYTGLHPDADYEVSVVYANPDKEPWRVKLTADDQHELQPFAFPPKELGTPVKTRVPREATRDGTLTLTWQRAFEAIGSGSGLVAEVWLRRVGADLPDAPRN